jgi:SAM-dependent methyltransferase
LDKVIQVNNEGKLVSNGLVLEDSKFGRSFFETLYKKDHICKGKVSDEAIVTEYSMAPLVVVDVEVLSNHSINLIYQYGHSENFSDFENLALDDWSRLCGENANEVPFVFSIPAQVKLFDQIFEPIDYDHFKFEGQTYNLNEWYLENSDTLESKFWSERYKEEATPWDLGKHHPALDWTVPRLKLSKSKVLVPGCGKGHDVNRWSELGHNVLGLDFSENAVQEARKIYPKREFECADFFNFADKNRESYDLVFEHTLFCALEPSVREKLVKAWHKSLRPTGHLLGVFLVASKRHGPPFGITEWELEQLLEKNFKIEYWGRLRGQETARAGKELFVYAQKK